MKDLKFSFSAYAVSCSVDVCIIFCGTMELGKSTWKSSLSIDIKICALNYARKTAYPDDTLKVPVHKA